jgi:hypothetical protein
MAASVGAITFIQGQLLYFSWEAPVLLTSYTASMAVNTLVTGLIVFKIVKGFLKVKATTTSVEQTLGLGSTGGNKLRQVIFVIIESAMVLFAIQLVRLVVSVSPGSALTGGIPFYLVVGIAQMLNVIIRSVHFLLLLLC